MISFTVNGKPYTFEGDPQMPLLWYLREELDLVGTKFGCGIGDCGACTILLNGTSQRSCITRMEDIGQTEITTIEGLEKNGVLHPVQRAWIEEDVAQCGYCQSGQIMATVSLLNERQEPDETDIADNITNLCRCATYSRIRKAIHKAATYMKEGV